MQLKLSTLVLFASLATSALACHHPKPNHDVTCKLSFNRGKLYSNGTHIIIQGTTTQSTQCKDLSKEKRDLTEIVPGGSVVHVFTKDSSQIKDANGTTHHGNDCQLNIPNILLPEINKKEITKLIIPLNDQIKIDCERRIPKSSQSNSKKAKPTPTETTSSTITSKKSKPTPKPVDEKEKERKEKEEKERKEKEEEERKEKEEKERKEKEEEERKEKEEERKEKEEEERKEKEKKEKEEDDDEEEDNDKGSDVGNWLFGSSEGKVTFFTPNQGACGDWNDDNDMIAAIGGDFYGDMDEESKYCGKKIQIKGPRGNTIVVTVKDACPPCDAGHVDLSPAAFKKLGDFDTGILPVSWKFLD